jgi:hypothetical protein
MQKFKDYLIESIESYAEKAGWDLVTITQQIPSAFQDLLDNYRKLIAEKQRAEDQAEFERLFEARKLEFETEAAKPGVYRFELKRAWSSRAVVQYAGISRSIFTDDSKSKGAVAI